MCIYVPRMGISSAEVKVWIHWKPINAWLVPMGRQSDVHPYSQNYLDIYK
jgi:hypothetical protein